MSRRGKIPRYEYATRLAKALSMLPETVYIGRKAFKLHIDTEKRRVEYEHSTGLLATYTADTTAEAAEGMLNEFIAPYKLSRSQKGGGS